VQEKNSRLFLSSFVILILLLVPVLQTVSPNLNFMRPQTANALADFTISASPSSVTNFRDQANSTTITVTSVGGFSSAVTLSVSGVPNGVSASFSSNPITPPAQGSANSTLALNIIPYPAPGYYTLNVTGTSGSISHSILIPYTLKDLEVDEDINPLTVYAPSSTNDTITVYSFGGFHAPVTLSVSGVPSNVTTLISPNPVTPPADGSATSKITITTGNQAAAGTYSLNIKGTSGSYTGGWIPLSLTINTKWHSSTGIVEPLYKYPYKTSCSIYAHNFCWQPVNDTKNQYPHVPIFVIVNPNSGAGHSKDSSYVKGIANLTKSGIIVLGYTPTKYGTRALATVEAEIANWTSWYGGPNGISGIELDEMTNNPGILNANVTYYQTLTNYIHNNQGLKYSFGNPGTESKPIFQPTVDLMNIFEGSTTPSNGTLQGKDSNGIVNYWHTQYDKSTFRFEQYGVASAPSRSFVQGTSVYDGYMFFTNYTLPNPWAGIPPYLNTLASYLNNPSVLSGLYAQDTSNNPITARILMTQSGSQVRNATTPFNYNETAGWQFVLNPQNSCPGHTFDHWLDTGLTTASRTIAPIINTNYTAVYRTC